MAHDSEILTFQPSLSIDPRFGGDFLAAVATVLANAQRGSIGGALMYAVDLFDVHLFPITPTPPSFLNTEYVYVLYAYSCLHLHAIAIMNGAYHTLEFGFLNLLPHPHPVTIQSPGWVQTACTALCRCAKPAIIATLGFLCLLPALGATLASVDEIY